MALQKLRDGRVLFVYWPSGEVTADDALLIPTLVAKAHREAGYPILYVAVASGEVPPPSNEVRKVMSTRLEEMFEHCESMHFVFQGKGFRHTIQRMAMVSITMVGAMRGRIFVESTLRDLVGNAPSSARADLKKATASAEASGFFAVPSQPGKSVE